jgi:Zn-dependent protease with chaperone function
MIRSLFVKIKYTDPGRILKEEEAPGLYALVREVATKIGTRPVDEIRITTFTDLAVYERGSKLKKMRNKAKRVLIVGAGILKDFKQNDFKAVIAHEYGHFSHRDTAGGEVALRVRNDMYKYIVALYQAGQTVWWNIAFQFLRLYDKIFRTISHGATRFQEVMADRLAAQNYGSGSFQDGLTYVVKRNLEFQAFANYEIETAKKDNRPISDLYELTAGPETTVEEQFQSAMNRETTNDDTHPSPKDRFRYVAGLGNTGSGSINNYVRDLFKDWSAITHEMTENIKEKIKET